MITMRRMSLRFTALTKDRTNQFILNMTSHDVAYLCILVKDILLNYGNELHDNGLLGPWSAVLLI